MEPESTTGQFCWSRIQRSLYIHLLSFDWMPPRTDKTVYCCLTECHPRHTLIAEESASLSTFFSLTTSWWVLADCVLGRAAITAAMLTQSSPTFENKLGKVWKLMSCSKTSELAFTSRGGFHVRASYGLLLFLFALPWLNVLTFVFTSPSLIPISSSWRAVNSFHLFSQH